MLRDDGQDKPSYPVLTVVQKEAKPTCAVSAAKLAAPAASSDDDELFVSEKQSVKLEPVTDIPKLAGSIDASRKTHKSEKGEQVMIKRRKIQTLLISKLFSRILVQLPCSDASCVSWRTTIRCSVANLENFTPRSIT